VDVDVLVFVVVVVDDDVVVVVLVVVVVVVVVVVGGPTQMWLRLSSAPSRFVIAPRSVVWPVMTLKWSTPPVFFEAFTVTTPLANVAVSVDPSFGAVVWTSTKCHRTWPGWRLTPSQSSSKPGAFQAMGGV
jgi:hypothetical protein